MFNRKYLDDLVTLPTSKIVYTSDLARIVKNTAKSVIYVER